MILPLSVSIVTQIRVSSLSDSYKVFAWACLILPSKGIKWYFHLSASYEAFAWAHMLFLSEGIIQYSHLSDSNEAFA